MARYASLVWAVPTALAVLVLAKGMLQPSSEAPPREQRVAPAIVERLPSQGRLRAPDDEPVAAGVRAAGPRARPASAQKSAELKKLAADARLVRPDAARPTVPPRREPAPRPAEPAEIFYPITSAGDIPSLPGAWSPVAQSAPPQTVFIRSSNDTAGSQAIARPMRAEPRASGRAPASVQQQVAMMNQKALRLAERGALYSARAELLEALRLVAQAQDAQAGGANSVKALDAGLTALDEADDFSSPRAARQANVPLADLILPHQTPVLKRVDTSRLSGLAASQHYLAYAQQQLAIAAGTDPVAAQSLYLLGKVHSHLAGESAAVGPAHTARAMVFHQAALAIDPQHYQAANELGVLLARFGELTAARKMLLASVKSNATPSAWHNLATVHERLGETDLAKRARYEAELLAGKTQRPASGHAVQWVDAATFAAQSPPDGTDISGGKASVATATVPATNRP
jgi:tetratricopeptide (TPR) repeat protein